MRGLLQFVNALKPAADIPLLGSSPTRLLNPAPVAIAVSAPPQPQQTKSEPVAPVIAPFQTASVPSKRRDSFDEFIVRRAAGLSPGVSS
jgi:hypothetical protein